MFNVKIGSRETLWTILRQFKLEAVTIDGKKYQVVGLNQKDEPIFIHEESCGHDSVPLNQIETFHFI